MRYGWNELLAAFKVDTAAGGGADFAELVLRLINGYRWSGKLPSVGDVVRSMAKERGCTTEPLYREMKRAVQPILDSDAAALRLWELDLPKRTSSALAAAIAEREAGLIQQRREPLPDKTARGGGTRKKSK